jgi:PAS domain S-box-containing protein
MKNKTKADQSRQLHSAEFYKVLYESANDAIFLMDEEVFIACNPKTLEMFRCSEDEIIGHTPIEFSPEKQPDGRDSAKEGMTKIKKAMSGTPQIFKWKHKRFDNIEFDAEVSLNRITLSNTYYIQAIVRDISIQTAIENEIKKSEQYYRLLIQTTNEGFWRINEKHKTIDVNDSLCQMLGYEREEMLGKTPFDFVDKDNVKIFKNQLSYSGQGDHRSYEIILNNKSGDKIYTRFNATTLRDFNGNPLGSFAFVTNITDYIKVQKELFESREKFKSFVETTIDIFFSISLSGHITYVSPNVEELYGYNPKDLIGKYLSVTTPISEIPKAVKAVYTILQGKQITNFEIDQVDAHGNIIPTEINATPVMKGGRIITIQGIMRNISERKKFETELLRQKTSFENIFNKAIDAIYVQKLDGTFIDINHAVVDMYGYSKEELIGQTPEMVSAPGMNDLDKVAQYIQKAFDGFPQRFEFWGKRKNGDTFLKDVRLSSGEYSGEKVIFAFALDISKRKEAEEKLRESEEKFKRIIRDLDVGFFNSTLDGILLDYNKAFCNILGLDARKNHKSTLLYDFWQNRKDRAVYTRLLMNRKAVKNYIINARKKNGKNIILQASAHLVHNEKSGITYIEGTISDITEQRKATEEIINKEKQYRMLFNFSPNGIIIEDTDGTIIDVNPAYTELMGYTKEELVGHKVHMLTHPDNRLEVERNITQLLKGRILLHTEKSIKKDGTIAYMELSERTFNFPSGKKGIVCIVNDITERKLAEKALQESEEKYRMIVENQTDLVIKINSDNKFTYISPSFCKLFRRPEEEILGEKIFTFVNEKDVDKIKNVVKALSVPPHTETVLLHANTVQGPRWLEWMATAVLNDNKEVMEIIGVGRDITEQKTTEEALKQSEERYKGLFIHAPVGIIILDLEGNPINANKKSLEIFGSPSERETGKVNVFTHKPLVDAGFTDDYLICIQTGKVIKNENFYKSYWGKEVYLHYIITPVYGENNQITGAQCLLEDITDRKRAEQSLKRSEEQLRQLTIYMDTKTEEEKKRIAREIHDGLGQLLTGLKMDLQWITKKWPQKDEILQKKLAAMNQILDDSVKEVQKLSIQLRPKMLDELGLLETIQWETRQFEERTGIHCHLTFTPAEFDVEHDRSSTIYRVLTELLTNIYRHAEATKVDIQLKMTKKNYILTVSDNGKGITQEEIDSHLSFGLISIAERVKVWNGQVNFKGNNKNGTTVIVKIPY